MGMTVLNVINLRQQINQLKHCGHLCSVTSWPTVCVCSLIEQYSWLCPNTHKGYFVHACEVSSEEDILHLKLLPAHSYSLLQKRLNVHHSYFHSSSFRVNYGAYRTSYLMNKTRLKDVYHLWHQCYATQMLCKINVRNSALRNVFLGNVLSDTSYASGII